jgi:hypothetical protein
VTGFSDSALEVNSAGDGVKTKLLPPEATNQEEYRQKDRHFA